MLLHAFAAFMIGFSAFIVSCNLLTLADGSIVSSPYPKNFLFGTASSSYQFEGAYLSDGKGLSNWDVFTHKPGKILDGSNGDVAVDHYYRYMEDINLMKDMGVNSYRFSISWARILPKGRFGRPNRAGINHYNNVINALLLKGILPFVTLTHYDIPQELEERYGGWLSPAVQEDFRYYADICFRSFGDRVKYWATFNEPNVAAILGYQSGTYPPSRCSQPFGNCTSGNSEKEPFIAAHNMILSHASAANVYRAKYQKKQGGSIGIVINAIWFEPISNSLEDISAAERAKSFFMNWFLDPIVSGNYPNEMRTILGSQLPAFSKDEMKNLKSGLLDFIGVNHYTSYYVKDCIHSECATGRGVSKVEGLGLWTPLKDDVLIGQPASVDWEYVYPQGMEKIENYLKERFNGTPMFITENGYGGQENPNSTAKDSLNDTMRVDYMSSYLDALARSIREGADVRGYFAWSLLDNFEWTYGYKIRFGLHHVDYATLKRTPRLSATWYKEFITDHVACQQSRSNCNSATY